MKKLAAVIMLFLFAASLSAGTDQFKWARVKFACLEPDAEEKWDIDPKADETFLDNLAKYTTLKVDKTFNVVTLDKLDNLTKYPLIFMTASGTPNLSADELKNLTEYMKRGGILLADDSNWPAKGGNLFFSGMKKMLEKQFPGQQVKPLPISSELFHCQFDLPVGYYAKLWYGDVKSPAGAWALTDEKGRLMAVFTLLLQNTWGGVYYRPEKQEESVKFGINLVVYSLTR